jgi:hypothetical protein
MADLAPYRDRTLNVFKSKMVGGGARPNQFEIEITFPPGLLEGELNQTNDKIRFFARATTLPSSTIGVVPVPYRGRILKIAGERTFDDWTIQVYNDSDFNIRRVMERWVNALNKTEDTSGYVNPQDYFATGVVRQLGRTPGGEGWRPGNTSNIPILRTYNMQGIWPAFISEIGLDYAANDTIEEFSVTFQVQYWTAFNGPTGAVDVQ